MVSVPKVFIKDGLQATKQAKEAVAKLEKSVKREVINTDKLVRTPAADLFEKRGYMEAEAFWQDSQNFANYARGQYLTEGGKEFQQANRIGEKVISKTNDVERGFAKYQGQCDGNITYYERNLGTGKTQHIELYNGRPYSTWDGQLGTTYYNGQTGIPTCQVKPFYGNYQESIFFAEDGKTVRATIHNYYDGKIDKIVPKADGGRVRYAYKNAESFKGSDHIRGDLQIIEHTDKNGTVTKCIMLHDGTKQPSVVRTLNPDSKTYTVQKFDISGNLEYTY